MLRDLHNWFFSEWFRHVFEIVASVLSLAVAGHTRDADDLTAANAEIDALQIDTERIVGSE